MIFSKAHLKAQTLQETTISVLGFPPFGGMWAFFLLLLSLLLLLLFCKPDSISYTVLISFLSNQILWLKISLNMRHAEISFHL